MLRFLLFLFILYLIYKVFQKLMGGPKKVSGSPGGKKVIDQMKACPQCGTYNPSRQAYAYKGLYFCDRQCLKAYQKEAV